MSVAVAPLPVLFPYFGGKSKVAEAVWDRMGNVSNYVEPFAGSMAVLLGRPNEHQWWNRIETINDADGFVSNFWRALQADPAGLADLASYPVTEIDLTARHLHLVQSRDTLTERLLIDHTYFDLEAAAYWVWGICAYVGGDWCTGEGGFRGAEDAGPGVYRKMPMAAGSHAGKGIHRVRDNLGPQTTDGMRTAVTQDFERVADRIRRVRVLSGDWSRVLKQVIVPADGHATGVFLDPPYDPESRRGGLYAVDSGAVEPIHAQVREWAISRGEDPSLRIIYCGYAGTEDDVAFQAAGWDRQSWKASGGYGLTANNRARSNASREVMWCSPSTISHQEALPL